MSDKLKVVFEKPYKDYTVGQEVEFEGRGNVTLANWCIANGLASVYEKSTKKSGCAGCDDKHSKDLAEKDAEIAELKAEIAILKGDKKPVSTDFNADIAIEKINALTTVEEINDFLVDETRKGVTAVAESKIKSLID